MVATLGAILLCALFSGLIAAAGSDGKQILHPCRNRRVAQRTGRPRAGLRKVLLVLEVSLTVVLLVGAGLLLKSYERLRNAGLGVPEDNVLTMHFSLPEARYKEPARAGCLP